MFIDYTKITFLNNIVDNVDLLSNEFNDVQNKVSELKYFVENSNPKLHHHVDYWIKDNKFHPDDVGYEVREGVWCSFPLYKMGFPINLYNVKDKFPIANKMMSMVSNLNFASYMRLDSKAKTTPHKHLMKNYIFHVLLFDIDAPCYFYVNGYEKSIQKKGDAVLFDYSLEHSSYNSSSNQRIDFTVDFDPNFIL